MDFALLSLSNPFTIKINLFNMFKNKSCCTRDEFLKQERQINLSVYNVAITIVLIIVRDRSVLKI